MKSIQLSQSILTSNQSLSRLVKWMLAAVICISLLFGGYYFWDRYVHLGDKTPIEMSISQWEQIVQENPSDPAARLNLAQHYIANGNLSQALDQAQEVLTAYPDNDGALLILGIAYSRLDQPQESMRYLEKYVFMKQADEAAPKDMVLEAAMFYLGESYYALSQPEQAINMLLEALHIDPTDADALYILGNAYAQTGQQDLALQAYQNAVRFVPNFQEAYKGMQASFEELGKPDYVLYAQGMEAYAAGNLKQARSILEQAALSLPDFAPVHLGLALTYEKLNETELARSSARRAVELAPDDFAANNLLSRLQADSQ